MQVVYIAENGQMAIHLPLTQARIGAFSTHTAHPEVLAKAEYFFSEALGLTFHIRNPYVHQTKGEVTKIVWDTTQNSWKQHEKDSKPLAGRSDNSLSQSNPNLSTHAHPCTLAPVY